MKWFALLCLCLMFGCEERRPTQQQPVYPIHLDTAGQNVDIMSANDFSPWLKSHKHDIKICSLSVGDRTGSGTPIEIIVVWESIR